MIQEHEKKWIHEKLMTTNHYLPVIWGDKILREGTRRIDAEQYIRLDQIKAKNKTVLDLGCNNGYLLFKLLERGATSCIGLDTDGKIINAAKIIQRYNNFKPIRFYTSDLYIADPRKLKADIVLLMSLAPANWLFEDLVSDDVKRQQKSLNFIKEFGEEIYIEPTNHHKQTTQNWEKDIILAKKHIKKLGWTLKFLTWTDYQKRPFMRLTPIVK